MLSVLSFKRSLFAGVLNDGANEVFLDGGKLQRFMESIDRVTAAIPAPALAEAPPATDELARVELVTLCAKLYPRFAPRFDPAAAQDRRRADRGGGQS